MSDPTIMRQLRVWIAVLVAQGLVMIWLGYWRLDLFDYTADDMASSHRFATMTGILLAPAVFIWRDPRWSRIGLWALWSLAIFSWGVMRVSKCLQPGCEPWELDIWPLLVMRLIVVTIFLNFVLLIGIAARARNELAPRARVVKR